MVSEVVEQVQEAEAGQREQRPVPPVAEVLGVVSGLVAELGEEAAPAMLSFPSQWWDWDVVVFLRSEQEAVAPVWAAAIEDAVVWCSGRDAVLQGWLSGVSVRVVWTLAAGSTLAERLPTEVGSALPGGELAALV